MDTHSLITVNKGTIDYLAFLIYSLPSDQRRLMLYNVTLAMNTTLNLLASSHNQVQDAAQAVLVPRDPRVPDDVVIMDQAQV